MRVAALDLGSNTSLMLIADVQGPTIKVVRDEFRTTRMGQDVQRTKKFHPEALLRIDQVLGEYSEIIKNSQVDIVLAMATSAARDAQNAEELFTLGKKHNIPIEIIPGEKEAEITFRGSTFDQSNKEGLCVVDIGGGSTEIIIQSSAKDSSVKESSATDGLYQAESLDVGSVRLTEMFVTHHPVSAAEIQNMQNYVLQQMMSSIVLQKIMSNKNTPSPIRKLLGVAGTPTTLATLIQGKPYDEAKIHQTNISLKDIQHWRDRLATMTIEQRKNLPGMDSGRADVIVAGLTILEQVVKFLKCDSMMVSDRGVRFGVALYAAERATR